MARAICSPQLLINHNSRYGQWSETSVIPVLDQLRPYISTAVVALLIAYFAYHAFTGEGGLLQSDTRDRTLAAKQAELAHLTARRQDLEVRARLLRDESLSADLLEERARSLLGFADPRDYVIRMQP
ncbi:MAG: septum formation initiator family protein [Phenylobacterium sp.]|nr:septum formation initiator family protein [Phenylobacterium sp.]